MYSHGKKVDVTGIKVVYTFIRNVRAHLKDIVEGETVHVVGTPYNRRAVIIPLPSNLHSLWRRDRRGFTLLRKRFAAALDRLKA